MPIYFTFILAFFNRTSVDIGRVIITLYALRLGAQPFTVGALAAILQWCQHYFRGKLEEYPTASAPAGCLCFAL